MKLAFIVPGFSADKNDWCIPAHTDIVRTLTSEHDIHVFTLRYPHRADTYRIGKAMVHSFDGAAVRGNETARLWQRVMRAVSREHSHGKFDIIHAIFGGEAGCVTVLLGKFLRVPSVVWLVDGELVGLREIGYGADLNARLRGMNELVLRGADSILCGCAAMTEIARARMGETRQARVEMLPLGVSVERFSDGMGKKRNKGNAGTGESGDTRYAIGETRSEGSGDTRYAIRETRNKGTGAHFVNVGSLVAVKDQATLLRAFALARCELPDADLAIVGAGPLENSLRALAIELQLEASVTFAGNVPHEQLPALYGAADVFAQASRHEGQGMALLEAAACGCALCGTNVGALRDFARRGAAIAGEVGDAVGLAKAMQDAFCARARLCEQSKKITNSEYSLERISNRLRMLYERLC